MAEGKRNSTRFKRQNLVQFLIGIVVILLLNTIGSRVFTRFDLTSEKRFTLSPATKDLVKNLDDIMFVKVYLHGGLPADLQKLKNSTREMLDEFRAINRDIEYEFINVYDLESEKDQNRLAEELREKGIQAITRQQEDKDGLTSKRFFPGAVVSYKDREAAIQLFQPSLIHSDDEQVQVNLSIEALEFNIANALHKLTSTEKPQIAFVEDHGELDSIYVEDIRSALSEYYSVSRVQLGEQLSSLAYPREDTNSSNSPFINKFDAIIIAKPTIPFSQKDLFIIDQFIMRGGKVLWLIDPVNATLDSLQYVNEAMAFPVDLGLTPMLATYGVRINNDLIQDLSAMLLPINIAPAGSQPNYEWYPWLYNPILIPSSKHPIVKNLDAVKTEFISSIDTISSAEARKTILLRTSVKSRILPTPLRFSFDNIFDKPNPEIFTAAGIPVAVLLEGKFQSIFRYRVIPGVTDSPELDYRQESKNTSMIVISDGDMIRNYVGRNPKDGRIQISEAGFDYWTKQTFANREFILNAVNYLCGDEALLEMRTRDITLRVIDKNKLDGNKRLKWQILNIAGPLLLIILLGIALSFVRRFRFRAR